MKKSYLMSSFDKNSELHNSSLEPALGHLDRVERSIKMVSKVLHLELADIILSDLEQDPRTREQIIAIGGAATRIAALVNEIVQSTESASTTGDNINEDTRSASSLESITPVASLSVERADQFDLTSIPVPEPSDQPRHRAPESAVMNDGRESISNINDEVLQPVSIEATTDEILESGLYSGVVAVDQTPYMELPDGTDPLEVHVYADMITINGKQIKLSGDRLYLFNSLMLHRQGLIDNALLKEDGFKGDTPAFHSALGSLIKGLNNAVEPLGVEAIKKMGQRSEVKYAVNPIIQLIETRENPAHLLPVESEASSTEIVKKN